MGTRYILTVTCPQCGLKDDDVYFAPTCDFVDWKCPECGHVVDLITLTGITSEDASNAVEIKELCARFDMSEPETVPCATCGEPTAFLGTKRCNNCWEIERRLYHYLKSEKGRDFVQRSL